LRYYHYARGLVIAQLITARLSWIDKLVVSTKNDVLISISGTKDE